MAAEAVPFPWRRNGGTISTDLDVIWGMSDPLIVDGQIRGAFGQGLGAALIESFEYDEDGNFLSGTFAEYLVPTPVCLVNAVCDALGIDHIDLPLRPAKLADHLLGEETPPLKR